MKQNYTTIQEFISNTEIQTREEMLDLLKSYQQAIDVNIIASITDKDGKILFANDRFCAISKYSREELLGQNHRIINSGYHPKEFFSDMWKKITKGEVWYGEVKNKAKDGSFYWVETVVLPIRGANQDIKHYLSLRVLITEKKKAEEERKEYTAKLKEMLHMTSHRVRSPLATCLGLMNLIEKGELDKNERDRIFSHLKQSAIAIDQFTHELTSYMHELECKYDPKNIS